jgi:hypothetical protein
MSRGSRLHNANFYGLGFSETASWESLVGGSCTSCQVTQDKSAYWTPPLYFQSSSGEFTLVEQVGGMLAYVISHLLLHSFPVYFSWSGDKVWGHFLFVDGGSSLLDKAGGLGRCLVFLFIGTGPRLARFA